MLLANLGNSGRVHDIALVDNVSSSKVTVSAKGPATGERAAATRSGATWVPAWWVHPRPVFRFTNIDDVVVDGNAQVVSGYLAGIYSGHGVTLVGSRNAIVRRNRFPERKGPKAHQGREGGGGRRRLERGGTVRERGPPGLASRRRLVLMPVRVGQDL